MSSTAPALPAAPPTRTHAVRARLLPGVGLVLGGLSVALAGTEEVTGWPWFVTGGALALFGFVLLGLAVAERAMATRLVLAEQEQAARQEIDAAVEQLTDDVDLRGLLRVNRRQMEAYETLTRRQAESSYRLSHVALGVGLVVVIAGSVLALAADETASKVVAATLASLAAAISGFIARTYLRIYERTLVQLNHYFEQPLVSSYVLTAERLIGCMSPERRDDALAKVVDELMDWRAPAVAGPPALPKP